MIELKAINNNNTNICLLQIDQNRKVEVKDLGEIKQYCEDEIIDGNIISIKYRVVNNDKIEESSNMLLCNIDKVELILGKVMDAVNKVVKSIKVA